MPLRTNANQKQKNNVARYAFTRCEKSCEDQLRHMSVDEGIKENPILLLEKCDAF